MSLFPARGTTRSRTSLFEPLERRAMLAGDLLCPFDPFAEVAEVAAAHTHSPATTTSPEAVVPRNGEAMAAVAGKPRLIVLTDIGGDPDDQQSMVRLLTYANEFQIEGLIAGALLNTPGSNTNVHLIHEIVDQYEQVRPNLVQHKSDFPTADELRSVVYAGQGAEGGYGPGNDTPASWRIIQAVDASDPRPVNVAIWGGAADLAQALWRVRSTRTPAGVDAFVAKLRIAWVEQGPAVSWIKSNFPNLWTVSHLTANSFVNTPARGMYLGGDTSLTTAEWVSSRVNAHQPYGSIYPTVAAGAEMKEGDTPTWFYFLPSGLSDPDHPEWGGWGGRYDAEGPLHSPAQDYGDGVLNGRNTVNRWRREFQNDFEARMDWTVSTRANANHNPVAVINQANALSVSAGQSISISAAGSWDPDDDRLSYEWFQYLEAGTYPSAVSLSGASSSVVSFTAPDVATPQTIHIVLRLRDNGGPNLYDYQRVVVTVTPNGNVDGGDVGSGNTGGGNTGGNVSGGNTGGANIVASNASPVVFARAAQSTVVKNQNLPLIGSATDADGDSLRYVWRKVSGPGGLHVDNPTSRSTMARFFAVGSYVVELSVRDGSNSPVMVQVNVTVTDAETVGGGNDIGGETGGSNGSQSLSGAVVDLVFKEGVGASTQDQSGNGNHGQLVNTEASDWSLGSVRLDGNERVRVRPSSSWNGYLDTFTVAAWVKLDEAPRSNYNSIISVGAWHDQRINVYPVNGTLIFYAKSGTWTTGVSSSTSLPFLRSSDDQFHHVVAVKDQASKTASLYVDGQLVGTDHHASGTVNLYGYDLSFCADSLGNQQISCSLSDSSMYKRALSETEVSQLYDRGRTWDRGQVDNTPSASATPVTTGTPLVNNPDIGSTSGAIIDLTFNDGTGTVARDWANRGNDGRLVNTEPTDWRYSAIALDNVDERVRVPMADAWSGSYDSFTVSTWIKLDDIRNLNFKSIASVGSWADQRFNIYSVNGQFVFFAASQGMTTGVSSSSQPFLLSADGQLHHIVAVKDQSSQSASLYVDGVLVGQDSNASGRVDLSGWDMSFCGNSAGAQQMACTLSRAAFYPRALSDADVRALHRNGS